MADNSKKKDELADINRVDVEPLTDADLDTVAGGGTESEFSPANNATTGCPISSNVANACC
jgi:hypothetical protein